MSKSEEVKKGYSRCTSCGYVHPITEPGTEVETVPVEVAPVLTVADVPQAIRCPLCGAVFSDGEVYTTHRANNCAPSTPVETGTGSPDPPDPLDLSNVPVAPIVDPADVVTIAPAPEDPNAP